MTRSTPIPESLVAFARASEPPLRALLEAKIRDSAALPVDLSPAFERLSDYVLRGGKRLRGALCLLGCAAGGGSEEEAFPAALGLELFHAYLLVHDDFMDRDGERRGGPTMHVALAAPGGVARATPELPLASEVSAHTAGSLAILLGSLLQAWAFELVLSARVPEGRALAAGQLLSRALADVTLGQALDIAAPLVAGLPRSAVLRIEQLKTGSYTFELPLMLGALLGGASDATRAALSSYARPLGQAFQIADDLLGTFGAPEQTGKSAGNDLREGKRTLLVQHALERGTAEDRTALLAGLGRADLTEAELEGLREILRRSGSEQIAREEAERLCEESAHALSESDIPKAVADELRAIARYAVQRQS